jgi:AraC-like DNA-binding protein
VEHVARITGTGVRALQRLFGEYVGVSPKWVIARYRLHEAEARLSAGEDVDLAALALDLGYYDQAHFTRDFQAIVGRPPAAYARQS